MFLQLGQSHNPGANVSRSKMRVTPRHIVATDDAIRALLDHSTSSVERFLNSLRNDGPASEVLELSGLSRPIWTSSIDEEFEACFTVGFGSERVEEVRLLYVGPKDLRPPLGELALVAGELSVSEAGRPTKVLATRAIRGYTPRPAAKTLGVEGGLDAYLDPDNRPQGSKPTHQTPPSSPERLGPGRFRVLSALNDPEELALRLSPEQRILLDAPRPLLIQGVAGSGKTTVLTHAAVRRLQETRENHAQVLLVVYQQTLKNFVESLLMTLTEGETSLPGLQVMTFRELCERVAGSLENGPTLQWADVGRVLENQVRFFRKEKKLSSHLSLEEILEEIRACIKGQCTNRHQQLIAMDEYLAQERPGLHVPAEMRKGAYEIAEKYAGHLKNQNLVDEMGAARLLLSRREDLPHWDHVLVDESQDYTLVELEFLASLAESPRGLVFAGDEFQVVHASQFDWDRVRLAINACGYNREVAFHTISFNYRNTHAIQALADSVLDHRAQALRQLATREKPDTDRPFGRKPVRLQVSSSSIKTVISLLADQIPSLGVIVAQKGSAEPPEWQFREIAFRRGFTPKSVKGIEFEVVCLVGFGRYYSQLGARKRKGSHATRMFKFNEVYVSVSRARRLLILLDEYSSHHQFWDSPYYQTRSSPTRSKEYLYETLDDVDKLIALTYEETTSSEEAQWRLAAVDFERQDAFAAAAECWQRAGRWARSGAALERAGRLADAADLYRAYGLDDRAARVDDLLGRDRTQQYERFQNAQAEAEALQATGKHKEAALVWAKAGNRTKEAECWHMVGEYRKSAEAYESVPDYQNAANAWKHVGEWAREGAALEKARSLNDALKLYRRHGHSTGQARVLETMRRYEEAASVWENAGVYREAARCWTSGKKNLHAAWCWIRANEPARAAQSYQEARAWERAAEAWETAGNPTSAAENWGRVGRHDKAAAAWTAAGKYQIAATAWERVEQHDKAASAWTKAGKHQNAAKAWERAEQYDKSASAWAEAGIHQKAATAWERINRYVEAAHAWLAAEQFDKAAELFEQENQLEDASKAWEHAEQHEKAASTWTEAGKHQNAAKAWERAEQYDKAADAWTEAGMHQKAATAWERISKHNEAARAWLAAEQFDKAAVLFEQENQLEDAARAWERAREFLRASRVWRRVGRTAHAIWCLARIPFESGRRAWKQWFREN